MTACMRARKAPWNVGFWVHRGRKSTQRNVPELAETDVGDRCAHRIERDCRAGCVIKASHKSPRRSCTSVRRAGATVMGLML
jgi:hypothetical protein